jgi:hypothetical protein
LFARNACRRRASTPAGDDEAVVDAVDAVVVIDAVVVVDE